MTMFPIVMSASGRVPATPAELHDALISNVVVTNPGYTANLPGTLIEDVSSTDVYALLQCDSAVTELVNSLTPYGANEFLLSQLGNVYGVMPGQFTNTSVYVLLTGPPGWVIAQGFTVTDGTYQYVIPDGGVIGAGGVSGLLYAVATVPGTWSVSANTVTQFITSIPGTISPYPTVTNPNAGLPASVGETPYQYRARVLQAGLAASQGMGRYLKTLLRNIPGVQARLVSVKQVNNPGLWEVICGGGDEYAVAYAIYMSLFDITALTGSVMAVSGITNANPGVVTTTLNHGFTTGQVFQINGATGLTALNGVNHTATVIDATSFSIGVDTTSSGSYTGHGVVTPNLRNVSVSLLDYPDTYVVPFVNPPQQLVSLTATWNTISTNYVNPNAVAQAAAPEIVTYINSIFSGQPINIFELNTAFQAAIAAIIPPQLLTRLVFAVDINGVGASPVSGTGEIPGDPESYFYTDITQITVVHG